MQLLKNDRIGTRSDFFRSGGSSLLAMRLVAIVQASQDLPAIDVACVFSNATVMSLAAHMASLSTEQAKATVSVYTPALSHIPTSDVNVSYQ